MILFFADFESHVPSRHFEYLYCIDDVIKTEGVFLRSTSSRCDGHDHMKFLHSKGYNKAAIILIEDWREGLSCIHFDDVQPQHEAGTHQIRNRTPWPSRQPTCDTSVPPFSLSDLFPLSERCLLAFDLDELQDFFREASDLLWTDYEPFDLPDFIKQPLDNCQPAYRTARYVIFIDGSSQAKHRHKPPERIADYDISDSWAFAVFAEQYRYDLSTPSRLQFLGCQCKQVLYESQAMHHIGTQKVGSDAQRLRPSSQLVCGDSPRTIALQRSLSVTPGRTEV